MQKFFIILFLFISLSAAAQSDSVSLKEAISQLDNALINKDEKSLEKILHDELSFGHSTGWAQTKKQVFEDFRSGKLVYLKFENSNSTIVTMNSEYATVRTNTNAEGTLNGNAFNLKMHVLQVWIKTKTGWQLLARQSAKN
jgi:hypothetical protein